MYTVGILGATGNIGQCLLPLLVKEPTIEEIRIVTKRPARIEASDPNIVIKEGDYCTDQALVRETLRGCSRLFVVLPQSLSSQEILQRGKWLVDCALASNVESIVRISSLGIDRQSIRFVGSQGPLGDAHVAVETYGAQVGLNQVSLRPTSLFSNLQYNVDEIVSQSTISTPLGTVARVNWVSCDDVARVAANVLVAPQWDQFGTIVDITGPRENTLGAHEMTRMISASVSKSIEYKEVDLPPVPDYAGLWEFLRRGGYDCHCDSVERITGKPGQKFSEINVI